MAFSIFVGLVRLIDRFFRVIVSKNGEDRLFYLKKFHLLIAGTLSAVLALNIDPSIYKSSIIFFWLLIRAIRPYVPYIPFGSTIVMALSSSQILSTWITNPDELDSVYRSFLNFHGGRSSQQMKMLPNIQNPCHVLHPGMGCINDKIEFFPKSLLRSIKLYLPVYLVLFLVSRSRNPLNFIKNISRSSLFLASYCTLAWLSACSFYKFISPVTRLSLMKHTWVAGLTILIERENRRTELAAYCLTYALDSVNKWAIKSNHIKPHPIFQLLIMSLSSGVMLYNHTQQPAILMKWLFKLRG